MLSTKSNNVAAYLASLSLSVAAPAAQPGSDAEHKATPHAQTDALLGGAAPGEKQVLSPTERIANAVDKIGELKLQAQLDKNLMNEPLIEALRKEIGAAVAEIVKPGLENQWANGRALKAAGLGSRDDLYVATRMIADVEINTVAMGIEEKKKELQTPAAWRPRLLSASQANQPQIVNAIQVGQGIEALIQDKKNIDPKAVADFLRALPERFKPMDADTSPVGPADSPEERGRLTRLRDNARQFETMRHDIDRRLNGLAKHDASERAKMTKKGIHVDGDPRSRVEILLETATAEDRAVIATYLVGGSAAASRAAAQAPVNPNPASSRGAAAQTGPVVVPAAQPTTPQPAAVPQQASPAQAPADPAAIENLKQQLAEMRASLEAQQKEKEARIAAQKEAELQATIAAAKQGVGALLNGASPGGDIPQKLEELERQHGFSTDQMCKDVVEPLLAAKGTAFVAELSLEQSREVKKSIDMLAERYDLGPKYYRELDKALSNNVSRLEKAMGEDVERRVVALNASWGWLNDDEKGVLKALQGLNQEEATKLREVYRRKFGEDLDHRLQYKLSDCDLTAAKALLTGDPAIGKAALLEWAAVNEDAEFTAELLGTAPKTTTTEKSAAAAKSEKKAYVGWTPPERGPKW